MSSVGLAEGEVAALELANGAAVAGAVLVALGVVDAQAVSPRVIENRRALMAREISHLRRRNNRSSVDCGKNRSAISVTYAGLWHR